MSIRGYEWLVILVIVLLLFGATRLPALARSLGQSWRVLRKEVKDPGPEEQDGDEPPVR